MRFGCKQGQGTACNAASGCNTRFSKRTGPSDRSDSVVCNYKGTLINGDVSLTVPYKRGEEPATFR